MDKALQTQLSNIEKKTGKSLDELVAIVKRSGLAKHGEQVALLQSTLGLGYGNANAIVHLAKGTITMSPAPAGESPTPASGSEETELDRIYAGPRAGLRPIHDRVMAAVRAFGDFEIAPKKTYLSLRRKKQFAMVGPATNTRVEVGLNMKGVPGTSRLEALPPGGMCQYKVRLASEAEVDDELIAWIRRAYDAAGA